VWVKLIGLFRKTFYIFIIILIVLNLR